MKKVLFLLTLLSVLAAGTLQVIASPFTNPYDPQLLCQQACDAEAQACSNAGGTSNYCYGEVFFGCMGENCGIWY